MGAVTGDSAQDAGGDGAAGGIPAEPLRRVAVVEDHTLVRDGLVQALGGMEGVLVVYEGASTTDVLALDPAPDLVLLDLLLGDEPASADDVAMLHDRGSRVLVVSALGLPDTLRAMVRVGVAGVVSKREDVATMVEAVRVVLEGGRWMSRELAASLAADVDSNRPDLSPQERRVLVLYASGLTLESVARRIGVRPATAREYLERVRAKYEAIGRPARTKVELTREAIRDGLVGP